LSSSEKAAPTRDPVREGAFRRIGQTLRGKFHLDALLGVGGMASVYAATHRNGSRVAIKLLHDHVSRDPDVRRLFRREALAANRIAHPGVVRVLDDDVAEDGCAFLVLPLLVGETLQARWERLGRRLPVREALLVAYAVLDTLSAAHAEGIVHRDIKPDNLFVTSEGDVRILDFGVARLIEQSDAAAATRAGHAIGTPAFMPPEQALGRVREIDGQSDLWAVGATMFTCLSGDYVHGANTASELLVYAATRPAPSLGAAFPEAGPELMALVDKALAFEKPARWPNADAMKAAVESAFTSIFHEPMPDPPRLAPPPLEQVARANAQLEQGDVHSDVTRAPAMFSGATLRPVGAIRGRALWLRGGAAGLAAAGVIAAALFASRLLVSRVQHAAADAGPQATPSTAEESAAYQSWRDAAKSLSVAHAAKAVAANPTLARVYLLRAIEEYYSNATSQESLQRAWEYQSQLSERERAVLGAYQPAVAVVPDIASAAQRLTAVYAQYPDYDLAAYSLAAVQIRLSKFVEAEAAMATYLRRNDAFPAGWSILGTARVLRDDVEGARDAYHTCLKLSPAATSCLADLALLDESEGSCEEAESLSRTWLAVEPNSARCFRSLARTVFQRGGSLEAASEILDRGLLVTDPSEREYYRVKRDLSLAVLRGDFDAAHGIAVTAEDTLQKVTNEDFREDVAQFSMRIELELGHIRVVDGMADAFGAHRDAWNKNDFFDYHIIPARMKYLAGTMSRDAFRTERDTWLAAQETASGAEFPGYRWLMAYADAVVTDADGIEAIEALPRYLPHVNRLDREADMDTSIGHAYLRAGRLDEARPFLERATHTCYTLDLPLSQTIAHLYLGELMERTGDRAGACAAYAVVLSRWGNARESRSAESARGRFERLACSHSQRDSSAP